MTHPLATNTAGVAERARKWCGGRGRSRGASSQLAPFRTYISVSDKLLHELIVYRSIITIVNARIRLYHSIAFSQYIKTTVYYGQCMILANGIPILCHPSLLYHPIFMHLIIFFCHGHVTGAHNQIFQGL